MRWKCVVIEGCKLLYPNGRILHAGGWIEPNVIWMYGHNEIDTGQYDMLKEVDWVSSACWLLKKTMIKKIGFLDEGFSPIYFEETDYYVRARKAGFKVIYNPKTVVIHIGKASTVKQVNTRFSDENFFS